MKKIVFLLMFLVCALTSMSQSEELDSLELHLRSVEKYDSVFVDLANELAFKLSLTDQQKSIYFINLAISAANQINYEKGLFRATVLKGSSFLIIGLPDQALSYYLEAFNYGASKYSIEYVKLHNNIGEVYRRKGVFDSSEIYFNRALKLAKENLPNQKPVIIYSNLGEVSLMKGNVSQAKEYFNACLENAKLTNHLRGEGYGYYGLAECAFLEGDVRKSIRLMNMSILARQKTDHKRGLIQSFLKMSTYYLHGKLNNADSAVFFLNRSERLAESFEANDLLNETYNKLYSFYLDQRQIDNAGYYLEKHKNLNDSIRNAEFIANVNTMQMALQAELVLAENTLLKQRQEQAESEEASRLTVIVLGLIIVGGAIFYAYRFKLRKRSILGAKRDATFTKSLFLLSKELNQANLDPEPYIKNLLANSRLILKSDRASFWTFDDSEIAINLNSINTKGDSLTPASKIKLDEYENFFKDFLSNRTVAISRVSLREDLRDIYENYFKLSGIESILNAPVMVDGKFAGLLSYSMTENEIREWQADEKNYVGSLADLITTSLAKHENNILAIEKEELIQKLKSRNRSLQEFNSVISHNLREPLTQIIGFSELLQAEEVELSKDIVERIGTASNKIDRVVKELSTVLNVADPKPSDFRSLSIPRLVKDVRDLIKSEVQNQSVTFEQSLEVTKIKSYKPFLSDALYHILSNAIKFQDTERSLTIKISSYEDELHQYIRVSDNGRGINLNKFGDKIFKMYQRYHLDVEGRGIGLFIVKSRVNALNGWVRLESEEGMGTSIILEFPHEHIISSSYN